MRSSGSRVDWKIFFCKFYEINSSQELFLYCKHFGVDGNLRTWRRKLITKLHANLVFQACISFLISGHLTLQEGKCECVLECYPVLSLNNGLKLSRSNLVLDAAQEA